MASGVDLLFVVFFGLFGVLALLAGLYKLWTFLLILTAETTDAASVSPGLTELEGQAKPLDGTVTAPFTGTECLAYECDIEYYRRTDDGSNWHTVDSLSGGQPFLLDDGVGQVPVKPSKANKFFDTEFRDGVGKNGTPPQQVQQYLDESDTSLNDSRKHRFTERRLDPGEDAYVLGPAHRDPEMQASVAIGYEGGGGLRAMLTTPYVLGDDDESTVRRRVGIAAVLFTLFGLVFTAIPLFVTGVI